MLNLKDILSNQTVRYAGVLVIGVAIGALFYPSKHVEDKISAKYEQQISQLKSDHQKELDTQKQQSVELSRQLKQVKLESDKKIASLNTQIMQMKSHQKTSYYKIVHPDGTVEIRKASETDVDESQKVVSQIQQEYRQKLDSVEKKWQSLHEQKITELQKQFDSKEQNYKDTIQELQKSHVEDVNKRKFGLEVGYMTNSDYYLHADADIFGPIFLGVQTQLGPSQAAGAGIGFRF